MVLARPYQGPTQRQHAELTLNFGFYFISASCGCTVGLAAMYLHMFKLRPEAGGRVRPPSSEP